LEVSYDSKIWQSESAASTDINGTNYEIIIKSEKNSSLRNNLSEPWKILISTTSQNKKHYEVVEVKIRTNEGEQLVFSGSKELPTQQIRVDGKWSGFWSIENSPVTINPPFYKGQKLEVIVKIRIDNSNSVEVFKSFKPIHLKGKEKVNVFTM
jgi:hypothetical protein